MKKRYNRCNKNLIICIALVGIITILLTSIREYKEVKAEESSNYIIPKPLSYEKGTGEFNLAKDTSIYIQSNRRIT